MANPTALQKRKDAENAKLHGALVKLAQTAAHVRYAYATRKGTFTYHSSLVDFAPYGGGSITEQQE